MFLPTMTDDDKCYEAFRSINFLYLEAIKHKEEALDKIRSRSNYPAFTKYEVVDDKMNKWSIVYFITSKELKRKHGFFTICYTTYEVPPKHKENDTNAGKGVFLFNLLRMFDFKEAHFKRDRPEAFMEIVPHALNRYTQRYLKPNGLDGWSLDRKIVNILSRFLHFDIDADRHGDLASKNNMGDSLCPYDIIMRGGGILKGNFVNNLLVRFTTYVSPDMMFEDQIERQEEMTKEHYEWKRKGWL